MIIANDLVIAIGIVYIAGLLTGLFLFRLRRRQIKI